MKVLDLVRAMERIAPLEHAESWDKVGLLVGHSQRELVWKMAEGTAPGVLLTIDLTERVLDEAERLKVGAVVAYHPPIFDPIARLTDETSRGRILLRAIGAGLAIYSPHTALDAVKGGISDWLCEGLSGAGEGGKVAGDCKALVPHDAIPGGGSGARVKIVTFVPAKDLEQVRGALASAGAGRIGAYSLCSFAVAGTGTFMGDPGTNPAAGKAGAFEQVEEMRLEMVCAQSAVALALETLRRFHPYEEPAIDVIALSPLPERGIGAGRRLVLDRPASLHELAQRLKKHIGRDRIRVAISGDDRPITRIGVVPGAGESLLATAKKEGCEVFVTGEMRHHQVMEALHSGMSVILGNHTSTERGYLPRLAARLRQELPGARVEVSQADVDPLVTV
ncbi:MAG: Nif3-like dinuclear metal center hexameric protein [Planctomycetota bacterium]|nr:Nif3-like dinuclear metal center hexameric protein [Planctomycetota bacterium]